jgi:hypothetical protein
VAAAASKQLALRVCRLCVGCARAGLVRDTRREWLVACKARAGVALRCFQVTRKGVRCTEARRAREDRDAWAGGFDGRAADVSSVRVVLLLRASASAMPPLGPSLLFMSLRKRRREKVKRASAASVHAVGSQGKGGWVRWRGSRQERLEGGVALEGLGERHATLGAELVVRKAAQTVKPGWEGPGQVMWEPLARQPTLALGSNGKAKKDWCAP